MIKSSTNIQVSIIILLYNADYKKMELTIKSAVSQKDVDFEIIVSDDGSLVNPKDAIEQIFSKYGYINYIYNRNEENVGTVKNILSSLELVRGKYVYLISPGDMIFDDYAMRDFYIFAEDKNASVCFGDYINYALDNGKIRTFDMISNPPKASIYEEPHTLEQRKIYSMLGANILGPSIFRKTSYALKYIGNISGVSKFVEDNTSILYSLAEEVPLYHYERNICWYEYGTGISTSGKGLSTFVDNDIRNTFIFLKKKYPKDRVLDAAYIKRFSKYSNNKLLSLMIMFIKHPMVFLCRFRMDKIKDKYIHCSESQYDILKEKIDIK